MKDAFKLTGVLTTICVVAGVLLAWVNDLTYEPIQRAAEAARAEAIKTVLPAIDNIPTQDSVELECEGSTWIFYVGRREGRYIGTAFEVASEKGYGGTIRIMVGATADGKLQAIKILDQKETPGLGAKIDKPAFGDLFRGLDLNSTKWAVRKDGGDIDQITAATISSRAVVSAIEEGIQVYLANKERLSSGN